MIEKLAKQTLQDLKKSKKEPYPLYYKEVFNDLINSQKIKVNPKLLLKSGNVDENFLNQTKQTAEFIHNTNESIKENSENFVHEIEVKDLNDEIKHLVQNFENDLLAKLDESNNKINDLQKELEKVYKELHIDSLTKAYSRKAFEDDLKKIIEAGTKRDLNVALVAVDLDHFKTINDTYGHLVGDFVLIKLVKIIKNLIRTEDKIYRFGGDEFMVLFNRVDKNSIDIITEKIRKKIETTKLKYKDKLLKVTISIGVACHIKNDTIDTWIHRADKALYDSKENRNKVTILC